MWRLCLGLAPFAPLLWLGVGAGVADPVPTPAVLANGTPVSYFQEACARCHGDYGGFYIAPVGGARDAQQLKLIIKEMAEGPGGAPLDEADLDLQTAYHLAMRTQGPFAVVNGWKDGVLSGEAQPGTQVWLEERAGQERLAATMVEHKWKLALNPATNMDNARLILTASGRTLVQDVVVPKQ